MEYILDGQAHGNVASKLLSNGFDVNALRPWIGKDGRTYIAQNVNGKVVAVPMATNATLRKNEWIELDQAIVGAAQQRLNVVADLKSAGLTYTVANGMGKTVLETERLGDLTPASVSMDPAVKTEADRPEFDLVGLPLPIIHKDFHYSARQIAASRNSGNSLDTTSAQLAARQVAEEAEKLALGVTSAGQAFQYGGYTLYGMTNFPQRITQTLTTPTGSNQATTVQEVLAMKQASQDARHYGPWMLYNSPAWDQYLDDDYSSAKGDNTLRERINKIKDIQDVKTADFLGTGFSMLLVQQSSDVVRLVTGMDITTLQWESMGGLQVNFKVMAIMVPQLRADFNGNTGIVHGSV